MNDGNLALAIATQLSFRLNILPHCISKSWSFIRCCCCIKFCWCCAIFFVFFLFIFFFGSVPCGWCRGSGRIGFLHHRHYYFGVHGVAGCCWWWGVCLPQNNFYFLRKKPIALVFLLLLWLLLFWFLKTTTPVATNLTDDIKKYAMPSIFVAIGSVDRSPGRRVPPLATLSVAKNCVKLSQHRHRRCDKFPDVV